MQVDLFKSFLLRKKITDEMIKRNLDFLERMDLFFSKKNENIDKIQIKQIQKYVDYLIKEKENSLERLISIARYYYSINRKDIYIYFTQLLGGMNVVENIMNRINEKHGKEILNKICSGLTEPELGTEPGKVIFFTEEFLKRIKENLGEKESENVITGNNHNIQTNNFIRWKKEFDENKDIDMLLKNMHSKVVEELEEHYRNNSIWFEQEVTKEFIDFVKSNQELLAGNRIKDKIFNIKIPYNPKKYLGEKDPVYKRYYACHCPFARESILNKKVNIDKTWCYCSGGFNKLKFDFIFGENLEVEVVESVLDGDQRCRFSFKIPEKYSKSKL